MGSVGRSGFSLPVSAPRHLRWGWLYFPAVLNMKEFSIFLSLLALDADVSVVPAFVVVLPGPSSVSHVTLVSLRVFFAEDVRCRPGVEGAFLAEASRLPAQLREGPIPWVPQNLPPGFLWCQLLALVFHFGRSPGHTCPSRTPA